MLRRLVSILCILSMVSSMFACGITEPAIPDDDDMDSLTKQLDSMSPMSATRSHRYTANRNAWKFFEGKSDNDKVGTIECKDSVTDELTIDTIYTRNIKSCLGFYPWETTFEDCVNRFIRASLDAATASNSWIEPECQFIPGQMLEKGVPEDWNQDKVQSDDVSRVLIQSEEVPDWVKTATIVTATGALILLLPFLAPSLCILAESPGHWSCPGNPLYPGTTPGDAPDTGDQ